MITPRSVTLAAVTLLVIGSGLVLPAPASAAARCSVGVPGDVNGDGHAEVAVSQLRPKGGAVHVFYGRSSGLVTTASGSARDDQYLDQSTAGVPGTAENGDRFGSATAFGDFDDDGCADLAIGVPGENGGDGAVTVLYGSRSGIVTGRARTLTFDGLFGGGNGAEFGASLVVGDLDGDGIDDLAAGAPSWTKSQERYAGGVGVAYGSKDGLTRGRAAEFLSRDTRGVTGEPLALEALGRTTAVGDFDGDGRAELALVAAGSEENDSLAELLTLERGPAGYNHSQPDPISQTAAQDGTSLLTDDFGRALAAGDFDRDGRDDLAIGSPGRGCLECDEEYGFGEVVVLPGSTAGLTTTGRQIWTQNSAGVPGTARVDEGFGAALTAGPFDRDTRDDLAVGAPEDEGHTGSVTVLHGGSNGLTGTGAQAFDQNSPGITGERGAYGFGGGLATAYVQRAGQANLIVAADAQDVRGVRAAGLVNQLAVTDAGPTGRGSRGLFLDQTGVRGKSVAYAQFGFELS